MPAHCTASSATGVLVVRRWWSGFRLPPSPFYSLAHPLYVILSLIFRLTSTEMARGLFGLVFGRLERVAAAHLCCCLLVCWFFVSPFQRPIIQFLSLTQLSAWQLRVGRRGDFDGGFGNGNMWRPRTCVAACWCVGFLCPHSNVPLFSSFLSLNFQPGSSELGEGVILMGFLEMGT